MVEIELNSASDNPLADGESDAILHGGHFYGGHVCAAMDTLKTQLANLIDLMDRQLLSSASRTKAAASPPTSSVRGKRCGQPTTRFKASRLRRLRWPPRPPA